jgi:hypothetical protein
MRARAVLRYLKGTLDMSPLERAIDQLGKAGVLLKKGAGEYHLSFKHDPAKVCVIVDNLDDAMMRGLELADSRRAALPPLGPMGSSASKRKGLMYRHNRKLAAKRGRAKHKATD